MANFFVWSQTNRHNDVKFMTYFPSKTVRMIGFAQQFRILSLQEWRRWRRHQQRWQQLPPRGRRLSESWECCCCCCRSFLLQANCSMLARLWTSKSAADFDAWEIIHTYSYWVSPKGCNKFFMPYIFQLVIWVQLNTAAQTKNESESRQQQLQQQLYTN